MRESRKAYVLALGAVGLAGALTLAALVAPDRAAAAVPTYVPHDGDVVARVPQRDAREVAERKALLAAPERVELAVELARADIARARSLSDPRYLGRAQATLGRWWAEPSPPPDVLLLRATIEQSLHDFTRARADLDQLVAIRPDDAQAHLTRAVVATVTADYAAARASCAHLVDPLLAATCSAPLDAIAGRVDAAYDEVAQAMRARRLDAQMRAWGLVTLAELSVQRGDETRAAEQLQSVLAIDPDDAYARAALADVMLAQGQPGAASELLAGREVIDNLLVRRAIAEHRAHGPDAAKLAKMMHDRIAAAAERGDRVHMREEAMFVLAVDGDATRAVKIATENWGVQKELADARLLVEAAAAADNREAASPVLAWMAANGTRDARLERAVKELP